MVSAAQKNIDKCRCKILKMAPAMATSQIGLVDVIVLEDMGLPTTGLDAGGESPTDPTALVARQ
jgi:hypothetical protein